MEKSIQLKTSIPGPKSQALMKEREKHVAPAGHAAPIFVVNAKGSVLEDVDGNKLLDFAAGIGVMNLGHGNESIVRSSQGQLDHATHLQWNVTPYEGYVKLAAKLNEITPGKFSKKTFLANSGAEAVENAIKIARQVTHRQAVICFDQAFHGRTYMALTLTAKTKPYRYGFAPYCPEVYKAPFPYDYRGTDSNTAFARFEELLQTHILPQNVAAVIIEPVTGEGGFLPASKEFMQKLQAYCRANGIIFIVDEIQSGFGRTGTMFACEQLGIEPDMITLAKGMGGGLPISALIAKAEIMDQVFPGSIGGTYGGNPVACAQALAVIEAFEKGSVLANAKKLGELIESRMKQWKEKFSIVGDARGLGPMRAIELVKDKASKTPNPDATKELTKYCYEKGLVLLSAGSYANVIRLLMPLVTTADQLEEGLAIIESGLAALDKK